MPPSLEAAVVHRRFAATLHFGSQTFGKRHNAKRSLPMITPVILCGGSGTRLWPASRNALPKQFVRLTGSTTSFQNTVLRVASLEGCSKSLIMTGVAHVTKVREQLAEIGIEAELLIEPEGRDSGPAVAAAAACLSRRDPNAALIVLASDHNIADENAFSDTVQRARGAIDAGYIVTFGVTPTHPATGYGYIAPGDQLDGLPGIRRVAQFVEKPNEAAAKRHIENGCLWNSGNLAFRAEVFLRDLQAFEPAMFDAVTRAVESGVEQDGAFYLDRESFSAAERKPVDTAVMERTRQAVVVEADMGWSDIGSWDAVWNLLDHDQSGNVLSENAIAINSQRTLVRSEGVLIAAIGVEDLVIVATKDAILVCRRDTSQHVKELVAELSDLKRSET